MHFGLLGVLAVKRNQITVKTESDQTKRTIGVKTPQVLTLTQYELSTSVINVNTFGAIRYCDLTYNLVLHFFYYNINKQHKSVARCF